MKSTENQSSLTNSYCVVSNSSFEILYEVFLSASWGKDATFVDSFIFGSCKQTICLSRVSVMSHSMTSAPWPIAALYPATIERYK